MSLIETAVDDTASNPKCVDVWTISFDSYEHDLLQFVYTISSLSYGRSHTFRMANLLPFVRTMSSFRDVLSACSSEAERWDCAQAATASGEARPKASRIVSRAFTALSASRGDAFGKSLLRLEPQVFPPTLQTRRCFNTFLGLYYVSNRHKKAMQNMVRRYAQAAGMICGCVKM